MSKHPRFVPFGITLLAVIIGVLGYLAATPTVTHPAPTGPLPTVTRLEATPLQSDPTQMLATWRIVFPVDGRVADAVAHDETRYMMVQRGQLQIVSDDQKSRVVPPGEIVKITAGAWHQWINRGKTEGELVAWGVVKPNKLHDACGGAVMPDPPKGGQ